MSCMILFVRASQSYEKREGSEIFKNKNICIQQELNFQRFATFEC